jgi:hypothetical protein
MSKDSIKAARRILEGLRSDREQFAHYVESSDWYGGETGLDWIIEEAEEAVADAEESSPWKDLFDHQVIYTGANVEDGSLFLTEPENNDYDALPALGWTILALVGGMVVIMCREDKSELNGPDSTNFAVAA